VTPRVWSRRKGAETPPPDAVYVGRPSPFGNPYSIGADGTRDGVIAKYRTWLMADDPDSAAYRERIQSELRGRDLVCWCAPQPCHADVLLEVANGPRTTNAPTERP
jgi:Domain of unknown function (DUF4326)